MIVCILLLTSSVTCHGILSKNFAFTKLLKNDQKSKLFLKRTRRGAYANYETDCMEQNCGKELLLESVSVLDHDENFDRKIMEPLLNSVGTEDYDKLKKNIKRNNCKNQKSTECNKFISDAIYFHFSRPCEVALSFEQNPLQKYDGEDRFCHSLNSKCENEWRTKKCICKESWKGFHCNESELRERPWICTNGTAVEGTCRTTTETVAFEMENCEKCDNYSELYAIGDRQLCGYCNHENELVFWDNTSKTCIQPSQDIEYPIPGNKAPTNASEIYADPPTPGPPSSTNGFTLKLICIACILILPAAFCGYRFCRKKSEIQEAKPGVSVTEDS